MARIVVCEFMDEDAVAAMRKAHDVLYEPDLVDRPADLARHVAGARALIVRNRTQVRGDLLAAAGELRCVGRLGVGLDNIDVAACEARGVAVYPATGANNASVAEYVVATAMMLLRGAYRATDEMVAGGWPRNRLMGREIAGKQLGLVGFGEKTSLAGATYVGLAPDQAVELLGKAGQVSDVRVRGDGTTSDEALRDAVAEVVPQKAEAITGAELTAEQEKPALAAALRAGRIGGAALDVFETEPLKGDAAAVFRDVPNLVLTPHIAGVTVESNVRVSWMIAEVVGKHLSGDA